MGVSVGGGWGESWWRGVFGGSVGEVFWGGRWLRGGGVGSFGVREVGEGVG